MKPTFARKVGSIVFAAVFSGGAAIASAKDVGSVEFANLLNNAVATEIPDVELVRSARPGFRPRINYRRNGYRQQLRGTHRAPWGKPRMIPYKHRAPNVSRDFFKKRDWSRDLKGWGSRPRGPVMRRYNGR
ncbi:MAG: hypothetical protein AAGA12_09755 [Pseudomonadota bacterium]